MEKILFGDNQFFGVNHMSEEKARAQLMRFADTSAIMRVLGDAYDAGIRAFMCTTHDRISEVVDAVKADPARWEGFQFYPCMPYAHKYANYTTELGILGTLKKVSPGGLMDTLVKGAIAGMTYDLGRIMRMLVDAEMMMFQGVATPVIFIQNVVTDLLLGLGMHDLLKQFHDYVGEKYGAEAGFITMNMPKAVEVLTGMGIEKPIVCANINKVGFRMCGGLERYRELLESGECRSIAMSVFASGAIRPKEAIDWVCGLEGLDSIVFGASSKANIQSSAKLIEDAWGREARR